jgi:hypothetical protein
MTLTQQTHKPHEGITGAFLAWRKATEAAQWLAEAERAAAGADDLTADAIRTVYFPSLTAAERSAIERGLREDADGADEMRRHAGGM